jgi:hypothetical protein
MLRKLNASIRTHGGGPPLHGSLGNWVLMASRSHKLGPRELRGGSRSLQNGHNLLKHIERFLPQFAK